MANEEESFQPKSRYLEERKREAQNRFTKITDEFKEILRDKVHPDNQTAAYKEKMQKTILRLLQAADEADQNQPGAGIFGLIALMISSIFEVKDENLRREVEIRNLRLEIERLKKQK